MRFGEINILYLDNQNGGHLATKFFFQYIFLFQKHGIYRFSRSLNLLALSVSCETENVATAAISVSAILINRSYFQLNTLKPDIGLYRFSGSIGIVRFHPNQGYSGHLDCIIDLLLLA